MAVTPQREDFDAAFRYERVLIKSSVAFSVPSFGFPVITIPHNLGYVPYFKMFYSFDATGKIYPIFAGPASFNIDGNSFQIDDFHADATNLYVSLENDSGGTITGRIYYRIYEEAVA